MSHFKEMDLGAFGGPGDNFFICECQFSAFLTFSRSIFDDSQTSIRLQEASQGFNKASGCFARLQ